MEVAIYSAIKVGSKEEIFSILSIDEEQYKILLRMIISGVVRYRDNKSLLTIEVNLSAEERMLFDEDHILHLAPSTELIRTLPTVYSTFGGDDETIGEYKKRINEEKNA